MLSKNVLQNYYFTIEINSKFFQMIMMWKIDFDGQILALFIELLFTLFTKYHIFH